jgi:hypothetical protein
MVQLDIEPMESPEHSRSLDEGDQQNVDKRRHPRE